jgi:hypothetical protein
VHGSVWEKDEGTKSQRIGKKTVIRRSNSTTLEAEAGVLELAPWTIADFGTFRSTVKLVTADTVENDTSAFGVDQLPIADIIVDPESEDQDDGADGIDQRSKAEIDS